MIKILQADHKFTTFLDPTIKTKKIAMAISKKVRSRTKALKLITAFVHKRIQYTPDIYQGKAEYFQAPDESLKKGIGDCEDHAFLIASILNGLVRYRPAVVRVTIGKCSPSGLVPRTYHAWTEARYLTMNWVILEGTSGKVYKGDILRYTRHFSLYPNKIVIHR